MRMGPARPGENRRLATSLEVAGETIGQWSANWWQYAYSFSVPNDPFTDTTGVNANLNQSGPVFYINQGAAPVVSRSFTVPAGTNLLVSIIAVELSQAELGFDQTDAQIRAATTAQANLINSLHATPDVPVSNIFGSVATRRAAGW